MKWLASLDTGPLRSFIIERGRKYCMLAFLSPQQGTLNLPPEAALRESNETRGFVWVLYDTTDLKDETYMSIHMRRNIDPFYNHTKNKYGFIFSVRKVNMFPLRGFDWMHYKSGEDTLCSSQFKSWQSQCTHPCNHVVEINGKFPLKFTWMGELSNSLLELTVLFARPDVPVTKLPKSLTENRRDCYNVSGYQKISWCGLDIK